MPGLPVRLEFVLGVTGGTPYDGRFVRLFPAEDIAGHEDIAVPTQNVAETQAFSIDSEGRLATQPSGSGFEFANIDGFSQDTLLFASPDTFPRTYSNCFLDSLSNLHCTTGPYTVFYICLATSKIQLGTPDYQPAAGCYIANLLALGLDGRRLQQPPRATGCVE